MRFITLALLLSTACTSDTELIADTGAHPTLYEGIGPQTAACTHYNCCAVLDGAIECIGGDDYGLDASPPGSDWIGLESSPRYLCAWTVAGEWTCWGDASNPRITEIPDVLVADIRLGTAGGIALTPAGALKLWGSDYFGQITDAPRTATYIAIESGYGWMCAAEDTGALHCWGIEDGEGTDAIEHAQVTDAPTGHGFRGLNRGVGDVLSGVDVEGRVYSWGGGYEFANVLDGVFVANVAPSDNCVCGQLPNGVLACAGALLEPHEVEAGDTLAQPIAPVTDVACGYRWCAAVVEGELVTWGEGRLLD